MAGGVSAGACLGRAPLTSGSGARARPRCLRLVRARPRWWPAGSRWGRRGGERSPRGRLREDARARLPHVTAGGRGGDDQPGGPGLRGARQASGRTLAGQAGPPCGGARAAAPLPRPSRGSARAEAKRLLRWAESASLPVGMENCPRSPRAARDPKPAGPR